MRKQTTRPRRDRPKNFTTCLRMEQGLYHNAHNLLIDACILYQHKSYPTAFAIALLAYEELGKLHLLDHINSESWGCPEQREKQLNHFFSGKAGFNHLVKQRWALCGTGRFSEYYHDGHLNRLKQACFYVGFRNGRITVPERIRAETAYNQIKRVLKLVQNTRDMPFLDVDENGKWNSTLENRNLIKEYIQKARDAVGSLRPPTIKRLPTSRVVG